MIYLDIKRLLLAATFLRTLPSLFSMGAELDCSIGSSSCESCHVAYPFCYWCDSKPYGQQCVRYYDNFVDIDCPTHWKYKSCNARKNLEREKLERIYKILLELRNRKKTAEGGHPDEQSLGPPLTSSSMEGYDRKVDNELEYGAHLTNSDKSLSEAVPHSKLKKSRLLRALELLKLIEKLEAQRKGGNMAAMEQQGGEKYQAHLRAASELLSKEGHRLPHGQQVNPSEGHESNQDLDDLLKRVYPPKPKEQIVPPASPTESAGAQLPSEPAAVNTSKTNEAVQFTTTRTDAKSFLKTTSKPVLAEEYFVARGNTKSTRGPTRKAEFNPVGCAAYMGEDDCNNNRTCSWCNLMDSCMNRNDEDMDNCYSQTKRSASYVIDRCLKHSECEGCVKDSKCFWCEKTKSCHVYPFFGYIPHNCPANKWYYKDCDVQLAIFIILFPLLIILIAMIIFYFCLRYCYYRKRTLKVPLFEKPGLIERKQGKKIYFMSGETEDEEYRTEQIRKKYKLPIEKEPLIAP